MTVRVLTSTRVYQIDGVVNEQPDLCRECFEKVLGPSLVPFESYLAGLQVPPAKANNLADYCELVIKSNDGDYNGIIDDILEDLADAGIGNSEQRAIAIVNCLVANGFLTATTVHLTSSQDEAGNPFFYFFYFYSLIYYSRNVIFYFYQTHVEILMVSTEPE